MKCYNKKCWNNNKKGLCLANDTLVNDERECGIRKKRRFIKDEKVKD